MHILLCSYWFAPSVGGVETTSRIFAEQFVAAGHRVTVVTNTPGPEFQGPYKVVRQPSFGELVRLGLACDIVFQNMIGLRALLSLMWCGKPVVIDHQSWTRGSDGKDFLQHHFKRLVMRFCHNVSISNAMAAYLSVPSVVIGNPYESGLFLGHHDDPRSRDIVFLGRLVSDKGCDVLVSAMGLLKAKGLTPSLTIIGDGPELPKLQAMTAELGLENQIEFRGAMGIERAEIVAQHRIMAIPSLWPEPFGVVALEGIASGCAIVASENGGLPDAVGPCGLLFPNGSAEALASRLQQLLGDAALQKKLTDAGLAHLQNFEPAYVAGRFLTKFENIPKD